MTDLGTDFGTRTAGSDSVDSSAKKSNATARSDGSETSTDVSDVAHHDEVYSSTETQPALRVALDVEGVLADVHGAFLPEYNRRHGTDYQPSDVTHWEWMGDEVPHDEFIAITDEMWAEEWEKIEPFESAIGMTTKKLAKTVDTLDIVTARTGVDEEMQSWLRQNAIVDYDDFVSIDRSRSKATLGYDVYIDDKPHLASRLDFNQIQFMVVRPYNVRFGDRARVRPVTSVESAVNQIELIQSA